MHRKEVVPDLTLKHFLREPSVTLHPIPFLIYEAGYPDFFLPVRYRWCRWSAWGFPIPTGYKDPMFLAHTVVRVHTVKRLVSHVHSRKEMIP
jgi:hypothetical protein